MLSARKVLTVSLGLILLFVGGLAAFSHSANAQYVRETPAKASSSPASQTTAASQSPAYLRIDNGKYVPVIFQGPSYGHIQLRDGWRNIDGERQDQSNRHPVTLNCAGGQSVSSLMVGLVAVNNGVTLADWASGLGVDTDLPYTSGDEGNITSLSMTPTTFSVTGKYFGDGSYSNPAYTYLGCDIPADQNTTITMFGTCGEGQTVNFATSLGTSGKFIANVTCHIYDAPVPPAAQPQSISTSQNTPKTINLIATGDPTSFLISTPPAHGGLSQVSISETCQLFSSCQVTYTPVNGYNGPDAFTFTASDGTNISAPSTVSIAVGTGSTFPITHMSDTTASGAVSVYSAKQMNTEYLTPTSQLVGKKIDSITIQLSKAGTPTGNVQIGVFNTDLSVKKLFGTKDASTLTTTSTNYTFQLTNNELYTMQAGDRIGVKFTGGSSTNYVLVMRDSNPADPFDGTNSYKQFYNTVWNTNLGEDLYMILKQTHG